MARKHKFDEYYEAKSLGAVPVANNKFCKADGTPIMIRSSNMYVYYLQLWDEIIIPKNYNVFYLNDDNNPHYFIFVKVKSKDGTVYDRPFDPNSLARKICPIGLDGHPQPSVKTNGSVADWYAKQGTVDNAMIFLAGKSIKVNKKMRYTVKDIKSHENNDTYIFTYEWKELSTNSYEAKLSHDDILKEYFLAREQYHDKLRAIQTAYISSVCPIKINDIVKISNITHKDPTFVAVESIYISGKLEDLNTYKNLAILIDGRLVDKNGFDISLLVHHPAPMPVTCDMSDVIEITSILPKGIK